MLTAGTEVKFTDESKEELFGVVVRQLPDFGDVVVNMKTRKTKIVRGEFLLVSRGVLFTSISEEKLFISCEVPVLKRELRIISD